MIPILRALFATCALILAGEASTPAARDASRHAAHAIRCEVLANGLVLVPVTINRSEGPHWFLLDTGAVTTMLSDRLAQRLGLVATSRDRMELLSGSQPVDIGHLAELRIGSERFTGIEVLWTGLQHLRAVDSRIEGVIAQDLLRTRNFYLDYESRRLMFNVEGGYGAAQGGPVPFEWADHRPMVRTQVHAHGDARASVERRLVIDSAASHVILFDSGDAAARPWLETLRRGTTAGKTMTMTDHGGSAPVMTATVRRLTLASTSLRDVRVALVPVDPRLGRAEDGLLPASLFRALYFDNRRGAVTFYQ